MISYQKNTIFFLFTLLFFSGAGQQNALKSITVQELKEHLNFIASDSLQGRSFDTPVNGLKITAEYLKNEAENMGLKPGDEGYFQEFELVSSRVNKGKTGLKIYSNSNDLIYKTDSLVTLNGIEEKENISGEIVFTGFGWEDEKTNYNDFDGLNIQNKIVLVAAGTPESFLDDYDWNRKVEEQKIESILKKGAKAVLIATSPNEIGNRLYNRIQRWSNRARYKIRSELEPKNHKFTVIPAHVADKILEGENRFNELLSSISKNKKSNSFTIQGKKMDLKIERQTEVYSAKNVVAMIEGNDSVLKNECIVYMAHYDHLGMDRDGKIFNGADDNGSGIVALLEMAEAYQQLKTKPRRSIVFVWVTAEEIGLYGSQFYTQHPVFPLEKTITAINLDMIGRVYESRDSVWSHSPKRVKDFDGIYTLTSNFYPELETITDSLCAELGLVPDKTLPDYFFRSSDHHHFHSKGVPIVNLATGYHADYHETGDEISKINFEKVKRVTDLAFLIGLELANRNKVKTTNN